MRLAPELKSKIDSLWDKFWSGGLSNPLQSIEQMSYLIFMNRLEAMDTFEQKRAQAKKIPYKSIFEFPFTTPPKKVSLITNQNNLCPD
ncbi:MAG: type I restriction-modification system subunit M N-terminal domain-containing protein [Methanoregula sp.]|nr:type I restriction-modification system subunit M N-terminal domain-containing protein [Methanoregula sp.]